MLWLRSLIHYLTMAVFSASIGAIFNLTYGMATAIGLLSCSVLYHLVNLGRLHRWVEDSRVDNVPSGILLWQEVFDRVYNQVRLQSKIKERLTNTLDRFTNASEALPDGVVILDEHDRIEWCNRSAAQHMAINRVSDVW
ncbi:MAG: phosphate regulon sensor protein PhoR, partial [Burkholderiales bacterium]|nr:phosphate regulon sensor protein PhoR [Burkholderiales bacterium]